MHWFPCFLYYPRNFAYVGYELAGVRISHSGCRWDKIVADELEKIGTIFVAFDIQLAFALL